MIGGHKGRIKHHPIIVLIIQNLLKLIYQELFLLLPSTCQEEDITLHALHEYTGENFYGWVCLFCLLEVLLTVFIAYF